MWEGKKKVFIAILLVLAAIGLVLSILKKVAPIDPSKSSEKIQTSPKIISGSFDKEKMKSEEEWKKILSPEEYNVLRKEGTEIPFTGKLLHEKRSGTYYSVGCDQPVFRSEKKYESGTGWPSFWDPINIKTLVLREDRGLLDTRVEVLDRCGGHLGHVFDDGPTTLPDGTKATGKRYCLNSVALRFVPDAKQ